MKLFFIVLSVTTITCAQNKAVFSELIHEIKKNTVQFSNHLNFQHALTFFSKAEWDSTLIYTSKVLNFSDNEEKLIDYCHFFRGFSFFNKEIYASAETELLKISPEFDLQPNVLSKLGSIALEQSDFEKALSFYKKVEKLVDKRNSIIKIDRVKDNIGICYFHLKKYKEAESYLLESVQLQEKNQDTLQLIGSYGNLANLYYEQYKDAQAIPYFEKAYELAKTTDDFKSKQIVSKNMAIVEENRKDFKKSLQYRKEYEQWKDSLTDQNKIAKVLQLEKKIAVEKEQKEVGILKAENKVKQAERNTFLYSAIILLLLLLVSVYFYREKVKANKIIKSQKESLDELNATKDKLFSIVSHDLRSSVNAIKTSNKKLVNTLETEDLVEVKSLLQNNSAIVNSAYNLLDNLLNWALLQTKQSYFEITKLRLFSIVEHVAYNYKAILADKEISFENKVDKNAIVYADQESLKIILRNLIDNAIKFSHPKGKIQIYTDNENENFCDVIIEDTGVGMDNTTRKELLKDTILLSKKKHENSIGTGLGLQLCKSMIKKNHGLFSIESELGKGTNMIISLPKNQPNGER